MKNRFRYIFRPKLFVCYALSVDSKYTDGNPFVVQTEKPVIKFLSRFEITRLSFSISQNCARMSESKLLGC